MAGSGPDLERLIMRNERSLDCSFRYGCSRRYFVIDVGTYNIGVVLMRSKLDQRGLRSPAVAAPAKLATHAANINKTVRDLRYDVTHAASIVSFSIQDNMIIASSSIPCPKSLPRAQTCSGHLRSMSLVCWSRNQHLSLSSPPFLASLVLEQP